MKQFEVSREFLEEYNNLNQYTSELYQALNIVKVNLFNLYPNLYAALFNSSGFCIRQLELAEVWTGNAKYVVKEQLYRVRFIKYQDDSCLNYDKQKDNYFISGKVQDERYQTKFTEQEIKDICPDYWNVTFLEKVL